MVETLVVQLVEKLPAPFPCLFPPFLPGFVALAVETRPGISENLSLQFPILRFALEVENSPKIGVPFEEVLILGLVLLPLKRLQEFESGSRFTIVTKSEGKVITSLFLDILVDGFDLLTGLTNFPLSEFEGLMVSVLNCGRYAGFAPMKKV